MRIEADVSGFERQGEALTASAARFVSVIGQRLAAIRPSVEDASTEAVRAVTPIGKSNPEDEDYEPGGLAASTKPESTLSGLELTATIIQDAEHKGFFYGQKVREGRRAITAPSVSGPWALGARALHTPWGWRKSVKASTPRPYQLEAVPLIRTAMDTIAGEFGASVLDELTRSIS